MNEERGNKRSKYETFIEFSKLCPLNAISNYIALRQLTSSSFPYADYDLMLNQRSEFKLDTALNTKDKVGVFFISGVPGSGKSDLASSFTKLAAGNNWGILNAEYDKLYDTEGLKVTIIDYIEKNPHVKNLVIVLRGYHLVCPYVNLVNKELADKLVNRGVITKINAMNFFKNKYKELLPCLAENCAKGVCNAIVVERGTASENKVEKVLAILSSIQDSKNILTMKMSRLVQTAFESLQAILLKNPMHLYNQYGYTFEKLFKSKYYVPKIMKRVKVNCAIPIQPSLFSGTLEKVLGEFVKSWEVAVKPREKVKPSGSEEKRMYVDSSEEQMILGKVNCLIIRIHGSYKSRDRK